MDLVRAIFLISIVTLLFGCGGTGTGSSSSSTSSTSSSSSSSTSSSSGQGIDGVCPIAGPCKILPMGDSITQGIGVFPGPEGYLYTTIGGYRTELFELAVMDGKNITFVGTMSDGPELVAGKQFPSYHEGHAGWLTYDFKDIIPIPVLTFEPHIVLLQMGSVDMISADQWQNAAQNLTEVVAAIYAHRPQTLIVIATLSDALQQEAGRNSFNEAVRKLADNPTDRVILADVGSLNLGSPLYPSQNDFRLIAQLWYSVINPYLRKTE